MEGLIDIVYLNNDSLLKSLGVEHAWDGEGYYLFCYPEKYAIVNDTPTVLGPYETDEQARRATA